MGKGVFVEKLLQRPNRNRSEPAFSMPAPSQNRSCGHTRPQISGRLLVARETSAASKKRPSATNPAIPESDCRADSCHARRVGAMHTTARLLANRGFVEETIDFVKVADTLRHFAFRRHFPVDITPVMFCGPCIARLRCGAVRFAFVRHGSLGIFAQSSTTTCAWLGNHCAFFRVTEPA